MRELNPAEGAGQGGGQPTRGHSGVEYTAQKRREGCGREVMTLVCLFNHFPHLRDAVNNPGGKPDRVVTMLNGFHLHQRAAYKDVLSLNGFGLHHRAAYKNVLSSIPCGVYILPGGSKAAGSEAGVEADVVGVMIQEANGAEVQGPEAL